MFWEINLKYLFLLLIASAQLGFAASKKSVGENKQFNPNDMISKGDGYEFKYTKDWELTEYDNGGAAIDSKTKKSFFISVALFPKTSQSMKSYLEGEKADRSKSGKRFIYGEMIKVDGREAALILKVDNEDEKDIDSQYKQSFSWNVHLHCAGQTFSIGYAGHLSKEERAEARKQRMPPKEFQDFLDGFKCLKD